MNTNLSQGIDIEEIIRFEKYENDINSKFLSRIFTKNELDYCFSKKNPAQHLSARFCAKEACIKALFPFENKKLFLKQIEIINKKPGAELAIDDKTICCCKCYCNKIIHLNFLSFFLQLN